MNIEDVLNIYLQPIFCSKTMTTKYAEILIRPNKTTLNVQGIINMFEEKGNGHVLDIFIVNKACVLINESLNTNINLTINLCSKTLEIYNMGAWIIGIVNWHGVKINRLVFEINEGTNLSNANVIRNIKLLIHRNANIAIDDFGQGNCTTLKSKKLNFKMVKFDRIFFSAYGDALCCLKNVINDMNELGVDTVIEGVETDEQLIIAKDLGYKNIQGFRLGVPVSVKEFKQLYN